MGSFFWGKTDLKWVAVARIGLKLWENEATGFRIVFKPDVYIKTPDKPPWRPICYENWES